MSLNRLKSTFAKILYRLPVIGWRMRLFKIYRDIPFPPGHYYSTIPDIADVIKNQEKIFENRNIKSIDLRAEQQKELLENLKIFYSQIPYRFSGPDISSENHLRYKVKNAFYRYSDVIFLFCMMRFLQPQKIIEVGSGHSSAVMLDTNEHFFENKINITFIEPNPDDRLNHILRSDDKNISVLNKQVQEVDTALFNRLNANDILFIDSSHISKVGSDVNFIFFEILPLLKPGVYIHFHDIFYPFELPKSWVIKDHWFWNENYILRAFLMNNPDYEIVLFNNFLHKKYTDWFEKEMPDCLLDAANTGSIWIRKTR